MTLCAVACASVFVTLIVKLEAWPATALPLSGVLTIARFGLATVRLTLSLGPVYSR